MTGEKWLPIVEVSQKNLLDYLTLLKNQNYKLVALEQTSKSVMLQNYKFEEKIVLVLGNEGLGIPVEIL